MKPHFTCLHGWRLAPLVLLILCLRLEGANLHGLFTDNMVLQRDLPIPFYGTGTDGEKVTVTLNGETATTTVADQQWKVELPAMEAGGPYQVEISSDTVTTLKNVLIGDIWLCTGQSNMAGTLGAYMGDRYTDYQHFYKGLPEANPMIRLFKLKQDGADTPQAEVVTNEAFGPTWRLCDEESALEFSATGYLFGRKLQPEVGVPVGLIYATLGGTKAESWVPAEVLRSRPEFKIILDDYEEAVANYPQAFEQYQTRLADWKTLSPEERRGNRAPQAPMGPQHPKRPSGLYNFMIAPLQQFPVKGAIWYQGEGNSGRPTQYQTLFPDLITSWREKWELGDFPFLFVQLAAFRKYNAEPEDTGWARLREAQTMTLSLPNTGMATIIDAGHQTDIHPPDKPTVGARLAAQALKVAYDRDIIASGPMFDTLTIEGNRALVKFANVGGGLTTKTVEADGHTVPADTLTGFAICGADKTFHWADAEIQGDNTVVVSSPEVESPVAVRYAWADFPLCNLYNREGFPAVPFRTDQFEMMGTGTVTGIAVGKPVVCNQPILNGKYAGLTDGQLRDSNQTSWATNGSMNFPKHVTVDLEGKHHVSSIRIHNSAFGGTKTVEVQTSSDGQAFETVGQTEFANYKMDIYELVDLNAPSVTHVRLRFPDIHETSFQRKKNGFIFLRELEIHGELISE